MNEINETNEIKIPQGVESISVTQHDDKIVIEFMPKKPKFKVGDKVKIKDGISSNTHRNIEPHFNSMMDKFIGKELTVKDYRAGLVFFNEDYYEYLFHEDWLEPYVEELKKGDLAIFWDDYKDASIIKLYDRKEYDYHYDSYGIQWDNAIKFESKEQFEKVLRGEI